ncbi:RNA 2',3'-cyclic phosphodiesterase [Deinococcus phoenicis]|uniref:RNA 2',3'-cyclic phosphodiesterase n=1 Tax=Deinococcus phoenicis TaxID=1476583 RepID=UPI00054EC558|nr:RNA 2',3'-cyclic phosphodiesterase [Deinococcus phoenicis]
MTKIRKTPRPPLKPVKKVEAAAPAGRGPAEREAGRRETAEVVRAAPTSPAPRAPRPSAPEDRTLRLFFALKVPGDVATPLAEAQRNLRGNWRAVRADQFHVTLAYLPTVPPERVDDLKRLGARLTEDLAPMQVRLRGTGYFPNEGSPRVWFVKVEAEGLDALAAALRDGIHALGLKTDDLPFKAHITLARKKGPAPRVPPLTFELGWQAGNAALIRSTLRKTGPIYDTESTFRLRGTEPEHAPQPAPHSPPPTPEETP